MMMELSGSMHRLELFGIPDGGEPRVRKMLARLLQCGSVGLAELQTARDIVRRSGDAPAEAYLFLAAMFLSLRDGNTFLRPEKGPALLEKGGYLERGAEESYTNEAFGVDVRSAWPEAVRAASSLCAEIVVNRSDAGGPRWFFKKNASAVDAVSAGLASLAARRPDVAPLSKDEESAACAFSGFRLNDDQVRAVRTAAERMFTVVTGGPGTGKTTIVCAVLRALMARGFAAEDIALAAPTGRAAQRMGEALREQCANAEGMPDDVRAQIGALNGMTIHSLLGGRPPNWRHTSENRLPLKLVVVDESSMVDVHLMKALVAALPPDCRLVLLGDRDQLPSVEAGAVLGDIVGSECEACVVRLGKSNRFTGSLAECAAAVKEGDVQRLWGGIRRIVPGEIPWMDAVCAEGSENSCFMYAVSGQMRKDACHSALVQWAERHGLLNGGEIVELASDSGFGDDPSLADGVNSARSRALFAALDRSRILTVVRQGPFGVRGVNDMLLAKRFGGRMPASPLASVGVPVIVTRNTPSLNLWNGDVGVTVNGRTGMVVLFPRGDRVVSCPVGLLPEHELAYAITVHKSQGSEFGNVLVVLPDDEGHPLLTRQLVYTGITRAKKRAVILGTNAALSAAVARNLERDSGISLDCPADLSL